MPDYKFLDEIMDSKDGKINMLHTLSGLLYKMDDEIFYHTVFAEKQNNFTPIVLTSWGTILPVKKELENGEEFQYIDYSGYRYKFANKIGFSAKHEIRTIDNECIKDIRCGKLEKKQFFSDILEEIKDYYIHFDKEEYDVIASAVVQSYLYQAIGKVFYLVLLGEPGSGKTALLMLLSHLCFNGKFEGKGTVPSSVRLIDVFGITLCQDEFDKMGKDEKRTFIGVANNGFNKGGSYTITDMNKKNPADQIVSFNSFCPKYFTCNSLEEFDDSFIDRCYIIKSIKAGKPRRDIYRLRLEDIKRFQDLRNRTFRYCLSNWIGIFQDIESVKEKLIEKGEFGREVDKLSITLGIIKHFKGEKRAISVYHYIKEKLNIQQFEDESGLDYLLLELIVNQCNKKYQKKIVVSNKWLVEELVKKTGFKSYKDKGAPNYKMPGKILEKTGVISKKTEVSGESGYTPSGARRYIIDTEKLRRVLMRNTGYKRLLNKLPSSDAS